MYVDQPNIKGDLEPAVYESLREAYKSVEEIIPHVKGTTPYSEIALLDSERSVTVDIEENRDRIMKAGADAFLSKPVKNQVLLQQVEYLLSGDKKQTLLSNKEVMYQ